MTLEHNRAITEFTVAAVDRYLQTQVPALVEQFLTLDVNGPDQGLPTWWQSQFDERLARHCERFVEQQLGQTVSTGLTRLVEPMVLQLVELLLPQLKELVQDVVAEEFRSK